MNGVHDMGGAQCYGPVVPEENEPVFHDEWERRAFAVTLAMGTLGKWNLDMARSVRESLPPAQYVTNSYYQIWLEAMLKLSVRAGLLTEQEIADGISRQPGTTAVRPLQAVDIEPLFSKGWPSTRNVDEPARFQVGDTVFTRNMAPRSHTRLPSYCRGKRGTIVANHGAHIFPDSNALGQGEQPQWLYTVRFEARDLWGADTTASAVHVDCWQSYLSGERQS